MREQTHTEIEKAVKDPSERKDRGKCINIHTI